MVELNIAFIGAGQVNFGGGEGPWNHAKRVEEITTVTVDNKEVPLTIHVVGIADPYETHARKVLENQRRITTRPEMWKDTQVFASFATMLDTLPKLDAVFIGVPPGAHGSTQVPNHTEIYCAAKGVHMCIEKPISCYPIEDVQKVAEAIKQAEQQGLVVSVAYMFRYNKAVQKIKEIIEEHGPVRAFNARYNTAYSMLNKEMWWDVQRSGGPIVEQATHFCDLARFFCGEVELNTVQATSIKQTEPLGVLKALPLNLQNLEQTLLPHQRVPRVTSAMWRFSNGAIGTLIHGVQLHGQKYEAEIEMWGDGYRIELVEPYGKCKINVRLPGSETTQVIDLGEDDMYFTEDKAFLESIVNKNTNAIQSSYRDAVNTYALTWKIRTMAEAQ